MKLKVKMKMLLFFTMLLASTFANGSEVFVDLKQNEGVISTILNELNSCSPNNNKCLVDQQQNMRIFFKKVNPTKYRVVICNTKDNFPIVFGENFHKYWYDYLVPWNSKNTQCDKNISNKMQSFQIVDGSLWETWFGMEFVVNDNNDFSIKQGLMANSSILIPPKYHWMANGFSNSWWIKPDLLKISDEQYFNTNTNGSYNFEMVIEFWPQRVYVGLLLLAGLIILISIVYIILNMFNKVKNSK